MAEFTKATRLPLEQAIEVVEAALEPADKVFLFDLQKICEEQAPEAKPILDHTIQVMVHGGYIRRVSEGPGLLAYQKTDRWVDRDETLIFLRAPRYKYRYRPRRNGVRIYPDAQTVEQAKKQLSEIKPQQPDMFGGR